MSPARLPNVHLTVVDGNFIFIHIFSFGGILFGEILVDFRRRANSLMHKWTYDNTITLINT